MLAVISQMSEPPPPRFEPEARHSRLMGTGVKDLSRRSDRLPQAWPRSKWQLSVLAASWLRAMCRKPRRTSWSSFLSIGFEPDTSEDLTQVEHGLGYWSLEFALIGPDWWKGRGLRTGMERKADVNGTGRHWQAGGYS